MASQAAVDFASIEEMDPSVADGFRVIYDREVPFELRLQESAEGPNDVGTLEAIKVRGVMVVGVPAKVGTGGGRAISHGSCSPDWRAHLHGRGSAARAASALEPPFHEPA